MVLYEVNVVVAAEVAAAYAAWLQDHIRQIVALDGFEGATWWAHEPTDEGWCRWAVQYRLRDRTALEQYLAHHAPALRQEGIDRFGGYFTAERRVMELRATF
jgi:hypothetical protein